MSQARAAPVSSVTGIVGWSNRKGLSELEPVVPGVSTGLRGASRPCVLWEGRGIHSHRAARHPPAIATLMR